MAFAGGITEPWSGEFTRWGQNDHRYYAKFWRNAVYWLTESSSIGRRRLIASADKKFYRPGESISLAALAYDEGANRTRDYRIVAMIEPAASSADLGSEYSPVRWPDGVPRTGGEEGPFIAWGEEFELAKGSGKEGYEIQLPIAEALSAAAATQALRIELTAYEDLTQVDSTSLNIQVLDDPFELQNPFPNHELLSKVAGRQSDHQRRDAGARTDRPARESGPAGSPQNSLLESMAPPGALFRPAHRRMGLAPVDRSGVNVGVQASACGGHCGTNRARLTSPPRNSVLARESLREDD
jgi:hypothetical protein